MMQVINQPDGSRIVLISGDAAESFINHIEDKPPPFDFCVSRPTQMFNSESRVLTRVFEPGAAEELGSMERRALHYQKVAEEHAQFLASTKANLAQEREVVFELRQKLHKIEERERAEAARAAAQPACDALKPKNAKSKMMQMPKILPNGTPKKDS